MVTSSGRAGRGRAVGAVALLVVGCLLAMVSVVAVWGRTQILDTDRYVRTVAPLADDPLVQDEVAAKVADVVNERLDAARLAAEALPERAQFLAGPLAEGASRLVERVATEVTHSAAFPQLWSVMNRAAHPQVVAVLTGREVAGVSIDPENRLLLDLRPVLDAVQQRLGPAGLVLVSAIPPRAGIVAIAKVQGVDQARTVIRWLERAATWLPLLALLCLAGAVLLWRDRRRMVLAVGVGLVAAMALLRLGLVVGRSVAVSSTPPDVLSDPAIGAVFDTVASYLRRGASAVAVAGLVLAVLAALASPTGRARTLRDAVARGRDRAQSTT